MPRSISSRALEELFAWAEGQDIRIDVRQQEQLETYLDNLLVWNRRVALVSQSDTTSILQKHVSDCLVAAQYCRGASRVVDVGSGAGFPGIIIALQNPAAHVTLVESRQKKASFLRETVRVASLENVEVAAERVETLASKPLQTGRYEISIARALGSVNRLLECSRALLTSTGEVIAMKGPSYQSEIAEASIERLRFQPPAVYPYSLPDHSQRVLLRFARIPGRL